jgi:geranylgeranyl reductase
MCTYDIAIVGAGPAGATLARLLDSSYRVVLIERRTLDGSAATPAKACGGLLAPAAQRELARQGLGVPGSVLAGPQLFAVRAVDLGSGIERHYQRHYVNVDRAAFDRWLVSLVPDTVKPMLGRSVTSVTREDEGFCLRLRPDRPGRAATVHAHLVVAADGAGSTVRHHMFGPAPAPRRYTAIQAEFERPPTASAHYGAFFAPELTDFYGWTIPKDDRLLVGLAMPAGEGAPERFAAFVEQVLGDGLALGRELTRSSASIARPRHPRELLAGDDGVLLAGEAAGLLSPSSAEGISYALRSAAALAGALEPGLDGAAARYRTALSPLAAEVTVKLAKAAAIHSSRSRHFLMSTGVGAIRDVVRHPSVIGGRTVHDS